MARKHKPPHKPRHKPAHRGTGPIRHSAHRTPWYAKPKALYSVLAAGLFVFGILLGTTIGLVLAPGDPSPSRVAVPDKPLAEPDTAMALPEGSPIPVTAQGSETARRSYEESLAHQPPEIRPNPDAAPPSLTPAPPPKPEAAEAPPKPIYPSYPESTPAPVPPPIVQPKPVPTGRIANAVPVTLLPGRPQIAIVFDDLGIDQPRSKQALDLKGPLTMAFLPYGHHLKELTATAHAHGHEILVHLPMAPMGLDIDPGPNALQKELGPKEILRRLDWNLSQFSGYIGVNNHMGSRFTADHDSMALVMAELKRRGLVFMDSVTTTKTEGYRAAAEMGVPYAVRDVFLDNEQTPQAIRQQLQRVEDTARRQGYAIAIGHPHDATLEVVRDWLKTVEAKGFQLVPVSVIIRRSMTG